MDRAVLQEVNTDIFTKMDNQTPDVNGSCIRDKDTNNDAIHHYIGVGLILVLAVFNLVTNGLVIWVMPKEPKLHKPLNYFIFSLAVSDFVHGILYTVYTIAHIEIDVITNSLGMWGACCTLVTTIAVSQLASGYSLAGLMFVRYIYVSRPLKYQDILTRQRVVTMVMVVWLFSVAIAVGLYARPQPEWYCGICRTELIWELYQAAGYFLLGALVPFILMIVGFILIAKSYKAHVKLMSRKCSSPMSSKDLNDSEAVDSNSGRKEKRLSLMTMFLAIYFVLAHLLFVIYSFIYILCDCKINEYFRIVARIVYFTNSMVNFMAYVLGHEDFRMALYKHLNFKKYRQMRARSQGNK